MKKHHWHAFWHEKLFEKHPLPHCQTSSKSRRQGKKILILTEIKLFYCVGKSKIKKKSL